MSRSQRWRHIGVFLVFLVISTSIGTTLAIISGNLFGANGYYVQLIMWSPAAAALLTALVTKTPLRGFGWMWGDWKWQFLAWLTPAAYVSIAYGLIWSMGWGRVPNPEFVAEAAKSTGLHIPAAASAFLMILFNATLGMLDFGGALGEEIGWRGFLVPALFDATNRNFTATALINAVIWACWHAPIIFLQYLQQPERASMVQLRLLRNP
jgi:membrane protease YdiL (CAAX protease family)